jgi:hypothetical protein
MPEHALVKRSKRWRMLGAFAAVAIVAAAATLSGSVAQGRVNPGPQAGYATALSLDTVAIVTGGGTFYTDPPANQTIASFGLTAKRPAGFTMGQAQGRINFDQHANITGRTHTNVPVAYMQAEIASPQTGNQTGGRAQLYGDCTQTQTECGGAPPGTGTVIVYVEDNSDSGAGSDKIQITYCQGTPQQVSQGGGLCGAAGPLTTLRTGNIQIRTNVTGSGQAPAAPRAPRLRP